MVLKLTLIEFEEQGGCEGCYFYSEIEHEGKQCIFRWDDDESDDWFYGKNCDDISE